MAGHNPFRRKQMQILGLDNSSYVSAQTSRSSEDGSSTISHYSDRGSGAASIHSSNSQRKVRVVSPDSSHLEYDSDEAESRPPTSYHGDDNSSFSPSNRPPAEENPFDEESDGDDFLEDFEDTTGALRRRRTVPKKAGSTLDLDSDSPWRTSTVMGNHPSHRSNNQNTDANSVPLKAQRMLGLSKKGRMQTAEDYRRRHCLSPQTENVAPKAQRMLGIPSNPFQKPQHFHDRKLFGDELERHGSKGPQNMIRKPMDVDEFKKLLLSGERNPRILPNHFNRDSSSNTDISSLSRSSMLSSQPEHPVDTPRSSHEFRPHLARIATDSTIDPAAHLNEPFTVRSLSAVEIGDSSPVNKPLPPTPKHTFELAGSEAPARVGPTPPARRGSQKGKVHMLRADIPTMIAELPASEPQAIMTEESSSDATVYYEMPAEVPTPGTEFAPVELPAREASPVEAAYQSKSLNAILAPQSKSAPAIPPPRRSASNRDSLIESLSPKSQAPPPRAMSTRLDRSIANALPPSSVPTPQPQPEPISGDADEDTDTSSTSSQGTSSSSSSMKNAPQLPPARRSSNSAELSRPGTGQPTPSTESPTKCPTTPTTVSRPTPITSPYARLPPLQTSVPPARPATNIPSATPIADSMVSAVTEMNVHPFSATSISTMHNSMIASPSSPARRAGLGTIAKAAVIGQKPLEQKHARQWSWEPGKEEIMSSVREKPPVDTLSRAGEKTPTGSVGEEEEDKKEGGEDEEKKDSGDEEEKQEGGEEEEKEEGGVENGDVLADLGALQREVDAFRGQYEGSSKDRAAEEDAGCMVAPDTMPNAKEEEDESPIIGNPRELFAQSRLIREDSSGESDEEEEVAYPGDLTKIIPAAGGERRMLLEGIVVHGEGTPF